MRNDDILRKARRLQAAAEVQEKLKKSIRGVFTGPFGWTLLVVTLAAALVALGVVLAACTALALLGAAWAVAVGAVWLPWRVLQGLGGTFSALLPRKAEAPPSVPSELQGPPSTK